MKEYLSHHQIEYEVKNVMTDIEAREEMMTRYQSMSTPTLVIDDKIVIGFDRDKIEKLLHILK